MVFTIGQATMNIELPKDGQYDVIQTPECYIEPEINFSMIDPSGSLPSWITHMTSDNLIKIETNDRNDIGSFTFSLVATA